jgi:hypothetical protein
MRLGFSLVALGFICGLGCATSTSELGPDDDSGAGGFGGSKGGSGGFGGSKGGSGGTSASGGTSGFGGSGGSSGLGGSGGSGGSDASGGSGGTQPDGSADAADSSASGFGDCVTQKEVDAQSTQPFQIGFCFNPFACFACSNDAVKPGDITCSPKCLCVPLPPICGDDAGSDAADAAESGDAADASDAGDASTG